jgi:hypothetical protein
LTVEAWTEAIEREKKLVELWAMRGSPIVIASEDLPLFTLGLLPDNELGLLRGMGGGLDEVIAAAGINATDLIDRLCERALEVLDGRILSKSELGEALVPAIPESVRGRLRNAGFADGIDPLVFLTLTASRLMSLKGIFVMAPRKSGKEPRFVRTDQWLGRGQASIGIDEARSELVRRFLRAFAPTNSQDLAWWANPQTSPAARKADQAHAARLWALITDEMTEVERPDGSAGFVLSADLNRLIHPPQVDGVRLLPPHDPLLMAHDREILAPREHHRRLWRSTGNPGVVLAGGALVAAWTAAKRGSRLNVRIEPLGIRLNRSIRGSIGDEAQAIAHLRGCTSVSIEVAD